jgi:hypothetical protein
MISRRGIKRIFLENSSYYLLAYQPAKDLPTALSGASR